MLEIGNFSSLYARFHLLIAAFKENYGQQIICGNVLYYKLFRVVLGRVYRGLTGGFLFLRNFSVAISVSPHVCFISVLILIMT